jgi:hypothetical protein
LLAAFAAGACSLVTDDFGVLLPSARLASAAKKIAVRCEAIDS